MISDLEPSEGHLGVAPGAGYRSRHPPTPARDRVASDLDVTRQTPSRRGNRPPLPRFRTDPVLARVVATGLQVNRQLDHKNAQEDSLSSDFSRVGIQLWAEMDARHRRTAARRLHLRAFNRARNGLAHDDQRAVAEVLAAGYRMDLAGIRQWRAALDGLADTMDDVLAAHLGRLFKVARPW